MPNRIEDDRKSQLVAKSFTVSETQFSGAELLGRTPSSPNVSHFWMPFTDNKYYKRHPRLIFSANGMYYYTPSGEKILDATSGLWCVNAGHGRERIVEAIRQQAGILDYAPTFQLGHPLAFELATELARILPDPLDRVFFTNSGSDAADTALKMALAYHRARGDSARVRLIGRQRAYHGVNFGGTSVGGIGGNRAGFGAQIWGVDHLTTTQVAVQPFTRGQAVPNGNLASELEGLVNLHGAETIAAVIVEPVAGSAGVLVPPAGYLEELRRITSRYGVLLIFDEVITGFGRIGAATASQAMGVVPDIITLAKGLTNGTVPMGAVVASRGVHDAVIEGVGEGIEFYHGYTYSGHPLAAAAGLATLETYIEDGLFERAQGLSGHWEDAMHSLQGRSDVIDVRNIGLMAGIELLAKDGKPGLRATEVFRHCFDDGLLIRVTGDTIALSPPLIVTASQIDEIVEKIGKALDQVA